VKKLEEVEILKRPGYYGKKRQEAELNREYGEWNWSEGWQVGNWIFDDYEAILLYEESYSKYLRENPQVVEKVVEYGECYDSEIKNIDDGLYYNFTCSPRHYQDVSVRRSLLKLGLYFKEFKGYDWTLYEEKDLLHIRGEGTNGNFLMPGKIPFVSSSLIQRDIEPENIPEWIEKGSVEEFWQRNKVIYREK
jgi:hypothetical protein